MALKNTVSANVVVTVKWQNKGRIGSKAGEAMALKGTSNVTLSNHLLPFISPTALDKDPRNGAALGSEELEEARR